MVSVGNHCARCFCHKVIFHGMTVADFHAVPVEDFDVVAAHCARCLCCNVIFHAMTVADFHAVTVVEFDASGCRF